jgi:hypothetical protein
MFVVARVRAQSLADALTWVIITRLGSESLIDEAIFQAQRLASSCERALGTRRRHYDGKETDGMNARREREPLRLDEAVHQLVVAALDREAAEALVEGDAGEAATRGRDCIRLVLEGDPDVEMVALGAGVRALDSLMSHDPDLIVIDESDGVGLITADEYRDLFALLQLLRDNKVELDRPLLVERIHSALDRGYAAFRADEDAQGIDAHFDHLATAIADELAPRTTERQAP